jgi:hypothetical protein
MFLEQRGLKSVEITTHEIVALMHQNSRAETVDAPWILTAE